MKNISKGDKYERLEVLDIWKQENSTVVLVKCVCGKEKIIPGKWWNAKTAKSCGCLVSQILKDRNALPPGRAALNAQIYRYRKSAKEKGFENSLTNSEMEKLFLSACHYCARFPYKEYNSYTGRTPVVANGIDRKDSNIGYTTENSVSCCIECNFLKGDIEYKKFLEIVRLIYENRINRPSPT